MGMPYVLGRFTATEGGRARGTSPESPKVSLGADPESGGVTAVQPSVYV